MVDKNTSQIKQQIVDVCHDRKLTCLHAIESGSRAWGFDSPNSDYDVRLIYCHEPDWYLQLFAGKDTFEYIDNSLFEVPFDIGGWDIRKAFTLLYKSNAVILEWLNSPIFYHSDKQFFAMMKSIQDDFFNAKALFFHYRGIAKNANSSLQLNHPIKLKKWFYLLRSLLASVWVLQEKSIPPVFMQDMLVLLNNEQQQVIASLVSIKQTVDESHLYQLPTILQNLTEELWQRGNTLMSDNPMLTNEHRGDINTLNEAFKKLVFNR